MLISYCERCRGVQRHPDFVAHVAGWRKRSSSEMLNCTKGKKFVDKMHLGFGDKGSVVDLSECPGALAAKA